jgi:hypothetical protein
MRSETKEEDRQKERYWAVYIYIYGIAHFSSGHKYVESGKKERTERGEKKGY